MMTAKTKLILKNCTRLVSFILILLLLLYGISFLLEPKNNDDAAGFVNPNASGYLSLEKDTRAGQNGSLRTQGRKSIQECTL